MRKLNQNAINKFRREDLAHETGIGFYTLGRIIRGEREATKPERLALCNATGLDEATLFFDSEDGETAAS